MQWFDILLDKEETRLLSSFKYEVLWINSIRVLHVINSGPVMVLVHGVGGSAISFIDLYPYLTNDVYVIELPLFGRTHTMVHDVIYKVVSELKFDRYILCGHSYGGYLSILFASEYPLYVEKLILIDPVGIFPTLSRYGAYHGLIFKYFIMIILLFSTLQWYWSILYLHPKNTGYKYAADNIHVGCDGVYWANPAFHLLNKISAPILFVYGEKDSLIPYEQGVILSNWYDVVIIKDHGHNPITSHTAEYLALYMNLNQQHTRTSPYIVFNPNEHISTFNVSQTQFVIENIYNGTRDESTSCKSITS